MSGSLSERGKALEDMFFTEKDRQLLEQLRKEMQDQENRKGLAAATGISNDALLDALVEQNLTAESMASVSLIPLVATAWADGKIDEAEREAVMEAASSNGIEKGSASHGLIDSWLKQRPSDELMETWKAYVATLKETLDAEAFSQLKSSILQRARDVSEAAGGILGFGKTSDSEAKVIAELESAFD